MKRLLFLVLFVCFQITVFSQSTEFIKYTSEVSRVQRQNQETLKWSSQDFNVHHLIVMDTKSNKVTLYADTKEKELDIIAKSEPDIKGTSMEYTMGCVDEKNIECTVTMTFLENKPVFMRINYNTYRLWYFISQ